MTTESVIPHTRDRTDPPTTGETPDLTPAAGPAAAAGAAGAAGPAALPPLLATPVTRAGRSRGTYTLLGRPSGSSRSPGSVGTPGGVNGARASADATVHPHDRTADSVSLAGPGVEGMDWGLVTALRTVVADRLAQAFDGAGPVEQHALGWEIIDDLLREHTADAAQAGAPAWTPAQRVAAGQAVFDAVFRLGRLQPLVDDDRVENIFILGADRVLLELVDGSRVPGAPVADSDEELIDFLRFLANRSESNPRPFSESHPRLHMKLDGGARLAATAWVVSRPSVVIRRHRLRVDSLDGWVERGCMSSACANFLTALVRASWSVVVSGPMSAGKTTLTRALCAQIPAGEAIGTFESEYELFLDQAGTHEVVIDWEARPGIGEVGPDGRAAGAFELADALTDSFRFALSRQIVGEIRGPEVWTMIKAMESGTGSLSTTHAADAETCIRKLVTCAMEAGSHVSREVALEKISGALDVIVQLSRRVETLPDGTQRQRRWVSEVVMVEPGEREKGYALTHLFGPSTTGPARACGILPPRCANLVEFGFDPALFQAEADSRRGPS